VTATTSGLGASLVEHILSRGDKVIATGRNAEKRLEGFKSANIAILNPDLTASRAHIRQQIDKAWALFGRIDVLFNNAGVSAPSSIEEAE
jgi:NAD(P)-dependent dehydrogenase (short-subunit alcohol dehydrogenase family)